jgi:hypothetical protein
LPSIGFSRCGVSAINEINGRNRPMRTAHSNLELVKALAVIAGVGALFVIVLHNLTALIP